MVPPFIQTALAWLGGLGLTTAGAAAFAYWLFKQFAQGWLAQQFAKDLEDHKHELEKEREHWRFEINKLLDRATKLHQHEFEVLPELWDKLNEAFGLTRAFVSSFRTYPDVTRMSEPELEHFLANSELADFRKDEIRNATDKTRLYSKLIFWHHCQRVEAANATFRNQLVRSGIFVQPTLKAQFHALLDIIDAAALDRRFVEEEVMKWGEASESAKKLNGEGLTQLLSIETAVQERLWQQALPASDALQERV